MQAPRTARELFDSYIPEAFAKQPARVNEIGAVIAFRITGEDGGEWTVDAVTKPPTCTSGISDRAQCTVEIDSADLARLLDQPSIGMQLYFQGKIRMKGDPMVAMKLQNLFAVIR